MNSSPKPPHGLPEIIETFGDIEAFITRDSNGLSGLSPEFEKLHIVNFKYCPTLDTESKPPKIKTIRCHRLLVPTFVSVFDLLILLGLIEHIHSIDGCFDFRAKRSGSGLSTHCWGIAIDINAATNRPGTRGDMDAEIIEVFKMAGFIWGGDWKGKMRDPMHFQFCSGY